MSATDLLRFASCLPSETQAEGEATAWVLWHWEKEQPLHDDSQSFGSEMSCSFLLISLATADQMANTAVNGKEVKSSYRKRSE